MASIQSIAITKERAYASLAETTRVLAERFGVEAPVLNIHKRYPLEYRQAQELARLAVFLEKMAELTDASIPSKSAKSTARRSSKPHRVRVLGKQNHSNPTGES